MLPEAKFRLLIAEQFRKGSIWSAQFLMSRDLLGKESFSETQAAFDYWLFHFNKQIYRRTFQANLMKLPSGNFKLSFNEGIKDLQTLSFLKNIPFESLDLTGSDYRHEEDTFMKMPLRYLSLSRTPSRNLEMLPWQSLEYLDLSHSKVDDLTPTIGGANKLKVLNILGCRVRNLERLLSCENLKILHLNKKDYQESILLALEEKGVQLIDG